MTKPLPHAIQRDLDNANAIEAAMQAEINQPPAVPAQLPAEQAPAAPVPVAQVPKVEDEALWKQRYLSYRGEADAKLSRAQQAQADADARVAAMEARLAEAAKTPKTPKVTEADSVEFGADLIDLIDRKVRDILAEFNDGLDGRLTVLEDQLGESRRVLGDVATSQVKTATDRFYEALKAAIPAFETINVDPAFVLWLKDEDEMSGVVRQDLLNKAGADLNVERVIKIFKGYIRATGTSATPANAAPETQFDTLAAQVAPDLRSVQSTPVQTQNQQPRVFTAAEVSEFYSHASRNKYTPEQRVLLENEINDALSNGRVSP